MADTVRTIAFLLSNEFQDGQLGTITAQKLRDLLVSLSPPETILTASTSTVTWNLATDPVAQVTLTRNTTITITNGETGRAYRLAVVQGGTGNNTVAITGATLLGSPSFHTAVNAINFLNIDISGGTLYGSVL